MHLSQHFNQQYGKSRDVLNSVSSVQLECMCMLKILCYLFDTNGIYVCGDSNEVLEVH